VTHHLYLKVQLVMVIL